METEKHKTAGANAARSSHDTMVTMIAMAMVTVIVNINY